MKQKTQKLRVASLLCLVITNIYAQQETNTAAGNVSGSGGTVTYSVGQVFYTTNTGTTGSVAQAVQQPFEISTVLGIKNDSIKLDLMIYPNPTVHFLTLKIEDNCLEKLSYQLYDSSGKSIESKQITSNSEAINMGNLSPAIYYLKISDTNKEVKTFKIIKR